MKQKQKNQTMILLISSNNSNHFQTIKIKFIYIELEIFFDYIDRISCLDLELIKNKEKSEGLDSEIRQLKKIVDDKNSYIDQVHKQLTRSNTVI